MPKKTEKKSKPKKEEKVMKQAIHKEFKTIVSHLNSDDLSKFVKYLKSPWRIWWTNFFAGMARGLGFVIGATVLVSIVVYFFVSFLVNLPWVGDTFQWVSDNVNLEQIQGLGNSLGKLIELQEKQVEILEQIR